MHSPTEPTTTPGPARASVAAAFLRRHGLRRLLPKPWARRWWLRRCAAVVLLVIATGLAVLPVRSADRPHTTTVVVARHDLAAGSIPQPADLSLEPVDLSIAPTGALPDLTAAVGRAVGGAVRRGEIITDVRLLGPAFGGLPSGVEAVPVRLADAGVAELLHAGSRVDLIATGPDEGSTVLAENGTVLLVPAGRGDTANRGRLIMVALPTHAAVQVAAMSLQRELTVTLR